MPPPELLIVLPVYNEQASVERVVREWVIELGRHIEDFILLAIDDGSSDATPKILADLKCEYGPRMECISRPNRGHGQTCIQGYQEAVRRKIPFILQIDSDGQSAPGYFEKFWEKRNDHDVIYGKRTRQDGFSRVIASVVLRRALRVLANVDCVDANVPYRLMNTAACTDAVKLIPTELSLANIGLAVCLKRQPSIRHGHIPIGFPARYGGEASVPFTKFARKAVELFRQLAEAGFR